MKNLLSQLFLITTLLVSGNSEAQQSQDFGDYVVHYNALTTNFITPEVAKAYAIKRSSSRVLINITLLKKVMNNPGTPVKAKVKASGTNLTGQLREIAIREIKDTEGAIYYIGEFQVHNLETYKFAVEVLPAGEEEPLMVKFQQQFYTE